MLPPRRTPGWITHIDTLIYSCLLSLLLCSPLIVVILGQECSWGLCHSLLCCPSAAECKPSSSVRRCNTKLIHSQNQIAPSPCPIKSDTLSACLGMGEEHPSLLQRPGEPWELMLLHQDLGCAGGGPGFLLSPLSSPSGTILLAHSGEEHHLLGAAHPPQQPESPDSCHGFWETSGRAGRGPGPPAKASVPAFCSLESVFLPRAGSFEHLRGQRDNSSWESPTPLTGSRKTRTVNAKLQPV